MESNNNEQFKVFLKEKKLTVKQVSARTGIPDQTLYNYTRRVDSPGYRAMPNTTMRFINVLYDSPIVA